MQLSAQLHCIAPCYLLSKMILLKEIDSLPQYYENLIVTLTTDTKIYDYKIDTVDDILLIIDHTK